MSDLSVILIIVGIYLVILLGIGLYASRRSNNTAEDYFLANRSFGPVMLAFTLAATLFSAIGFLGFSGQTYGTGLGYLPAAGLAPLFWGIMIYVVGYRVWLLGKKYGFMTPAELIGDRFNSKFLRVVFMIASVVFVFPYLALQPVGAGYLVQGLTKGAIPYMWGAFIIVAVTIIYVFIGGMRSVVWTDFLQGAMTILGALTVLFIAANAAGGFAAAGAILERDFPKLLSRPGLGPGGGLWTWQMVFSWTFLFVVNIALQPPMFVRFLAAKSARSLKQTMIIWPWVYLPIIFPILLAGVLTRASIPNLQVADQAIPALLSQFAPTWLAALVLAAAIATMMSTIDSQFLVMSQMVTRDLYVPFINKRASLSGEAWLGRVLVVAFGAIALFLAASPPAVITTFAAAGFTGIAVLTPAMLAALYWRRTSAAGAISSIIIGEGLTLLYYFNVIPFTGLPNQFTFGFLPVVPVIVATLVVLVAVSYATKPASDTIQRKYFGFLDPIFTPTPAPKARLYPGTDQG